MAAPSGKSQTIIIKRIKKGGHGAHGGAWKIAYADFVTAMMAFFLLMWLLSATTDEEKEKLSEYFSQPVDVALFGDTGSGAASLLEGKGAGVLSSAQQQAVADQARMQLVATLRSERERADFARLEKLRRKVENAMLADPKLEEALSQLKLAITTEGLRIQIFDAENKPMFDSGSAVARPQMRALLRQLGAVLTQVPNQIAVEGHTDGVPYGGRRAGYSNWELSSDRANASRRELVEGGLPADRIMRVQGMASTDLFDDTNPASPGNRRIVIVVLTLDAEEEFLKDVAKTSGRMVDDVPGSDSDGHAKASVKAKAGPDAAHAAPGATSGHAH
ncbi:flagellar motor protein MotB [Myxococcota bacterium]|nr:flagellar motor protein MotB [Myxococcota bacterium]